MAVYNAVGTALSTIYDKDGVSLQYAYDKNGTEVFSGEEPFVPTTLAYDTNWVIKEAWLTNAATQRDAVKALYQASDDAIPFFIQSDGHGRFNEGNKGCHNLAESTMGYIRNIQLGDYASYWNDGETATNHIRTSAGITKYVPVLGNHEFMCESTDTDREADIAVLVNAFTPTDGILGSQTYGYYKIIDEVHNVKYLVGQMHIPDSTNSSGFISKCLGVQWEWFIDEMESNDGYDIVILNHEPFPGTYIQRESGEEVVRTLGGSYALMPLLSARKAKTSGTITDADGVTHSYDFTGCTSDLLCALHGHVHKELYIEKTTYGFPVYVAYEFANYRNCCYGLIDRDSGRLYIYAFTNTGVSEPLVLDL